MTPASSPTPKTYKLIIFDADGTLRRCTVPGQPCPNKEGEWELIPGVRETLGRYDWMRTGFGVASNQGGIAIGYMSLETARELLEEMVFAAVGVPMPYAAIQICPHSSRDTCGCRKPEPGMLHTIMKYWGCYPSETLYVGDMDSDRMAAERAGCDFMWAREFFNREPEDANATNSI